MDRLDIARALRSHAWRAVVRPEALRPYIEEALLPAEDPLSGWIDYVWALSWSGPVPAAVAGEIGSPSAHVLIEDGATNSRRHGYPLPAALFRGVFTGRVGEGATSAGWMVKAELVPGAILDLTGEPASTWTGKISELEYAVAGWDLAQVWRASDNAARALAFRAVLVSVFSKRIPSPDGSRARDVARIARTGRVRTVDDLASATGLSLRSLQRLCSDHIGVSPGWLLRRERLIQAHRLLGETNMKVGQAASRLGWYDQAHFTRDYLKVTGFTPARLRRQRQKDRHLIQAQYRYPSD